MKRGYRLTVVVCAAAAAGTAWGVTWFADEVMTDRYPGKLAYSPVADMPPAVDLGSVQRSWPAGLGDPADRARLTTYMRDIERQSPAPLIAPIAATPVAAPDLGTLLASADPTVGKAKAQVCTSCHDFRQGGPDSIGPNLWGVIGRTVGSRPGFAYSTAMVAQTGSWSYAHLFEYLASPARVVPGTKMAFSGLRRPEDRAAILKYLSTLSASPPPLPAPSALGGGTKAE